MTTISPQAAFLAGWALAREGYDLTVDDIKQWNLFDIEDEQASQAFHQWMVSLELHQDE